MKLKIFPDIESLNNFAAEKFVEIANEAIKKRGDFAVALSGGSTPKGLYSLLVSDKFKDKIDWSKVFFFFGDERNVPPDNAQSNFRMANENLFTPLGISEDNIRHWDTEYNDDEATWLRYESRIALFFDDRDRLIKIGDVFYYPFDLILLGMGADGHTASLFPFSPAVNEDKEIVVANYVEKLNETRFTFTFRLINNAANIIFLVAGEEKAEALREVLRGEYNPEKFPAQKVKPNDGNLLWLVDAQATRLLQ